MRGELPLSGNREPGAGFLAGLGQQNPAITQEMGRISDAMTASLRADKPCPHEDFEAFVEVNRIVADGADAGAAPFAFAAEVGVKCAQCGEPFTWVGAPAGLSPEHPTSSIDKLILNAPLRPSSSDPDFGLGMPGYAVTAHAGDS